MERLVEVTRGPIVESVHRGTIAVVNSQGELLAWVGDPSTVTYYRSCAKPIQALPVITSGAAEHFKLDKRELAIICASHSGEEEHVKTVLGILDKLSLKEDSLLCGVHPPLYTDRAVTIWREGKDPSPVHCNCSGKHSGMLALCQYYGWPLENYLDKEHPLQQLLLKTMQEFHDYKDIVLGVDGCGVPVYGMPVKEMAKGFARLVNDGPGAEYEPATKQIVEAMTHNPRLVAGTGRLDTILMDLMGEQIVTKAGAEGVQCIGLRDKGIGIAIKIEDGNGRATEPVAVEVLHQLGIINEHQLQALAEKHYVQITNHRKEVIGEIRPAFKLKGKGL